MSDENIEVKSLCSWTREELLDLPTRPWDSSEAIYQTLLILSTGLEHDSGWAMMAIIGCDKGQPVEIAVGCCDDIEWKLPAPTMCGPYTMGQFRTDCALNSGALQVWARGKAFKVGIALSSTEIEMVEA